jgi:hypothetical protein
MRFVRLSGERMSRVRQGARARRRRGELGARLVIVDPSEWVTRLLDRGLNAGLVVRRGAGR